MTTRTFFSLMALLSLFAQVPAQADSISSMTDATRDYTVEGDVVTVWEDSFLFNDGSGQVIVDIRPYTTRGTNIKGRDSIQVTGHMLDDGIMRPLVMQEANSAPIMFGGEAMLEPLPLTEVMRNTIRYRIAQRSGTSSAGRQAPRPVAAAPAAAAPTGPTAADTARVDEAVRSAMAQQRNAPVAPAAAYGTPNAPAQPSR